MNGVHPCLFFAVQASVVSVFVFLQTRTSEEPRRSNHPTHFLRFLFRPSATHKPPAFPRSSTCLPFEGDGLGGLPPRPPERQPARELAQRVLRSQQVGSLRCAHERRAQERKAQHPGPADARYASREPAGTSLELAASQQREMGRGLLSQQLLVIP